MSVPAPAWRIRTPLLVALGVGVLLGGGMLAGIAIPASERQSRPARTAEVAANIRAIVTGAIAYAEEHGAFPPAVPRTPALASTEERPWPADANPGWDALGFHPSDPIRYSYEFAILPNGDCAARAYGDLDGDGVESLFEIACGMVDGVPTRAPGIYIERELE